MPYGNGFFFFVQAAIVVLHVVIARGVHADAQRISFTPNRYLRIFTPMSWALVCLLGGLFALTIYALLHYSRLARVLDQA